MAWIDERNKAAKDASCAINLIAKAIMQEWGESLMKSKSRGVSPSLTKKLLNGFTKTKKLEKNFLYQ